MAGPLQKLTRGDTKRKGDARARSAHLVSERFEAHCPQVMRRELSGLKVMRELSGEISPLSPRTLVRRRLQ
jgi:hypothetical protein